MRIGVTGAAGQMGRAVIQAVLATPGVELVGVLERADSDAVGSAVAGSALAIGDRAAPVFEASDAVIDFSAPAATAGYAEQAAAAGVALVTGTTGLAFEEQAAVQKAAETVCIVQSANFSLGVNLLLALTHKAAKALDESFDIEILELHHNHKADAPSGTALALGRAAAEGRNVVLDDVADRARDGITGARRPGDIGFASLRGGTAAGDHTVLFAGPKERIELTHRAEDRAIFATGAVAVAQWTKGRPAGLYAMSDVLGI